MYTIYNNAVDYQ